MDKVKELTKLDEIKIFSVPYRMKILDCMYSFKTPATVKNIADKMGETPAKIHYHIKIMETVGIVQLVYTENIHGIIAKFYEPTAEQYKISHNSGQVENKFKILNETQKAIASAYDESKRNFLEQIERIEKLKQIEKTEKKHNGLVMASDLYITEEEFVEMQKEIENIHKKYSSETNKEGTIKYKTFFSIIG